MKQRFLKMPNLRLTLLAAVTGTAMVMSSATVSAVTERLSWQTFSQDPERVASLRKAIEVMKSRNNADKTSKEYRQSWEYWANMHGYYGPQSPFGTVEQNKAGVHDRDKHFFDGINDQTPPDSVAEDVWAKCQHSGRNSPTPWFFAWHRFYLYYLEKQLQAASGDDDLRLPYWDYTDPNQVRMPAAFTQPKYTDAQGVVKDNPLYEWRRAPSWEGNSNESLDPDATNINSILDDPSFDDYQSEIEGPIHGYVHCAVATTCPTPTMGAVPYSSNDPIFWLHHANIDRTWSCWRNMPNNEDRSDPEYANEQFSFINQSGNLVTHTAGEVSSGGFIDYQYEQETDCKRDTASVADKAPAKKVELSAAFVRNLLRRNRVISSAPKPLVLNKRVNSVNVNFHQTAFNKNVQSLAFAAHDQVQTKTRMILSDVSFEKHPGSMFDIYVQAPSNKARKVYVGTLSFFTALPGVGHQKHHNHAHETTGLSWDFDVTNALRQLGNSAAEGVVVSFEATTGRTSDKTEPRVNSNSDLNVGRIDFEVQMK